MYEQAEGTFTHAAVDENDPAIVAMRARRVIAELPILHSSLPGAVAFPMIVRGQLIGTLLCGPKTEDETYAPDELDALSAVAAAVAHALDGLRITELEQTVERLLAAGGSIARQPQ
jgi:GAF domain-containing protein